MYISNPHTIDRFFYTLPSGACSSGHNDPTNHVIQTLENRPSPHAPLGTCASVIACNPFQNGLEVQGA